MGYCTNRPLLPPYHVHRHDARGYRAGSSGLDGKMTPGLTTHLPSKLHQHNPSSGSAVFVSELPSSSACSRCCSACCGCGAIGTAMRLKYCFREVLDFQRNLFEGCSRFGLGKTIPARRLAFGLPQSANGLVNPARMCRSGFR